MQGTRNQQAQEIIDLRHDDVQGRVRVTFPDKHVQIIAVENAVRACGAFAKATEFGVQFDDLLQKLATWSASRQTEIAESFLTARDGGLLFLVVLKSPGYSVAFEDQLTELDVAVANDPGFDLIRLGVLAIPPCSKEELPSFLGSETQIRLWKDGN